MEFEFHEFCLKKNANVELALRCFPLPQIIKMESIEKHVLCGAAGRTIIGMKEKELIAYFVILNFLLVRNGIKNIVITNANENGNI